MGGKQVPMRATELTPVKVRRTLFGVECSSRCAQGIAWLLIA